MLVEIIKHEQCTNLVYLRARVSISLTTIRFQFCGHDRICFEPPTLESLDLAKSNIVRRYPVIGLASYMVIQKFNSSKVVDFFLIFYVLNSWVLPAQLRII